MNPLARSLACEATTDGACIGRAQGTGPGCRLPPPGGLRCSGRNAWGLAATFFPRRTVLHGRKASKARGLAAASPPLLTAHASGARREAWLPPPPPPHSQSGLSPEPGLRCTARAAPEEGLPEKAYIAYITARAASFITPRKGCRKNAYLGRLSPRGRVARTTYRPSGLVYHPEEGFAPTYADFDMLMSVLNGCLCARGGITHAVLPWPKKKLGQGPSPY